MARGGATATLRAAHAKSIKVLAWVSFVLANAAGALLPGTFVGRWVVKVLGWIPDFGVGFSIIALILIILALAAIWILDPLLDLEPNQGAIWAALLLPSICRALPGGICDWIQEAANAVLHAIDGALFKSVPAGAGSTALAIGTAFAALLVARRVVRKSGRA